MTARRPDRRLATAVAWLALAAPGTALAGPPYATDDPEPVEYRHWEIYIASQSIGAEGGPREVHAYLGWQLGFGPRGREAPAGAGVSRGGAAATGAASR